MAENHGEATRKKLLGEDGIGNGSGQVVRMNIL